MIKTVIVFILMVTITLHADIIGIGFGGTYKEAKQEALTDLSQNIKSEVRSNMESTVEDNNGYVSKKSISNIKISSNLPILGAELSYLADTSGIKATAILKGVDSLKLYKIQLHALLNKINKSYTFYKKSNSNTTQLETIESIFSLLDEYERYSTVAKILGMKQIKQPVVSQTELKNTFDKLVSNIDSLSMATAVLSASFDEKNIFLYPPLLQNYTTVSQFGSVFEKELKAKIKLAHSLRSAAYILTGEYIKVKNGLVLHYKLLDIKKNIIVKSKTIKVPSRAYKDLKIEPDNRDFDTLLNAGVTTSSKFHVTLSSNKGSSNLLFREGETVELFVKLNKMGYIYIAGYTQTKDKKFSYLLELSEAPGAEKFLKFINADDASRWISLGEFTVEPPFGVESLQVIASSQRPTQLPYTKYNQDSGYYIISKNLKKALISTRGLKLKKSKKVQTSEDILSFTTIK